MIESPIDIDEIDSFDSAADSRPRPGDEGVVVVKQGVVQKTDEAMARMSGYRHEEVVDTVFASFFHLEDIPLVESICNVNRKSTRRDDNPIVRLIDKNGAPIPVQISVGPCAKDERPANRIKIRHI